ncbi:MAG TPA: SDR family oxidoreductase [Candidatus Angelobacter sp.]|jgi:NAD(P)-dependent dehydrogenase (short-subunit alcohol dehydrogenase family)|nr:SDR family oxidoreductase [Candidatus Angelobacter sp.]
MHGKVVVITGATSGIGQVASEKLAGMGARMVLVARNKTRGEAALARLRQISPAVSHTIYYGDLSRLSEMKRVAGEISAAEPRVDLLINNAGAMFGFRQVTGDGLELTFATNHMSYFVLTHGLRKSLQAAAPARVVNTSSDAHKHRKLDFNDLQSEKNYRGFPVYGRSKLANILFTSELARRLSGTGVTANCLHPGFVATAFGNHSGGFFSHVIRAAKVFAISPEKGAETIIYLASSGEVANVTGKYFYKCRPATPTKEARDDESAKRLWLETTKLAGMED